MISRRADHGIASSDESSVWPYWSRSRGPPAWRDAQDPCAHQLIVRATLPFGAPRLQVGHRLLGLGDWSDAIDGDPKLVGVEEGAEIGQVRTTRITAPVAVSFLAERCVSRFRPVAAASRWRCAGRLPRARRSVLVAR